MVSNLVAVDSYRTRKNHQPFNIKPAASEITRNQFPKTKTRRLEMFFWYHPKLAWELSPQEKSLCHKGVYACGYIHIYMYHHLMASPLLGGVLCVNTSAWHGMTHNETNRCIIHSWILCEMQMQMQNIYIYTYVYIYMHSAHTSILRIQKEQVCVCVLDVICNAKPSHHQCVLSILIVGRYGEF